MCGIKKLKKMRREKLADLILKKLREKKNEGLKKK